MGCRTAIVIVNWNTRALLLECLESVRRFASGAEVWVVDNASHDGSAEAVRERFPEVRLLANAENVGFARANNQAIRAIDAPYVWLLNSDTVLREGALAALEAVLNAQPRVAAVGSGLLNPDGSPQACSFAFPTPLSSAAEWLLLPRPLARMRDRLFRLAPRRTAGPTDWVLGASMLVRRAAIDAVGLLDEGYFIYSEELDWCHRFADAGYAVHLAPESGVVHHGGASTRQMPERMLIELFRSRARYFGLRRSPRAEARFRRLLALGARWNAFYLRLRGAPAERIRLQGAIARLEPAVAAP